jgi:2-iminobutanoate/2-iminopropanoate deaminase
MAKKKQSRSAPLKVGKAKAGALKPGVGVARKASPWRRAEIRVPELAPAISHYTDAVKFGSILFISGIVAVDKNLKVVGGDDIAAQTRCIFEQMKKILTAAGATFSDVLKVTIFLLDVVDRTKINPIRQEYFGTAKPASTLIGVRELALPGLKIEIEAVVGLRKL